MKPISTNKAARSIIKIDEKKCTGCGECIPNCPEGALQVIDGKARLISDLFCDGLGACIGHCPEGAIAVEEREAEKYDERKVMGNIVKQGENTIKAHLKHLKEHNQDEFLAQALDYLKEKKINVSIGEEKKEHLPCAPMPCGDPIGSATNILDAETGRSVSEHRSGCPGTALRAFEARQKTEREIKSVKVESQLTQWPVQLMLVPPTAPFLKNRDLVIAADCVSYAYGNFHEEFLKNKALLIACPKLDDTELYLDKLTQMFKLSGIKSITVLHMEVPCCSGIVYLVKKALEAGGKKIPAKEITIGIQGDIKGEKGVSLDS